ncbi:uncharacterized protein LOC124799006 [Schistocerca piceifrons]|uniref:uncharacterized protein LOC124799006 n=1 Tax=Schistocerca piceifrons TaxID=274613 RepID=UPI001F5E7095|nr:uncharacterized protein LOC124799006 [Schistocerca piceifrons]
MWTVAPWTLGQLSSPECSQLLRRGSQKQSGAPYFGLAARCARSQHSQLAMVDDVTRRQCELLAARKEALAFSYSSRGRQCLVNACPEIGARASLAADRRFLYYSRYPGRAPGDSWQCVAGEGVFRLQLRPARNVSEASRACARRGARLAHVAAASSRRSLGLAALLPPGRRALVGLRAVEHGNHSARPSFQTVTGVPLSCYLYRAWAPRHPRTTGPDNGCVTLDSSGRWRTTRCAQRHAFLCELLPPERRSASSGAVKGDLTAGGITSEDVTVLDYCSKNDSLLRKKEPDLWAKELK